MTLNPGYSTVRLFQDGFTIADRYEIFHSIYTIYQEILTFPRGPQQQAAIKRFRWKIREWMGVIPIGGIGETGNSNNIPYSSISTIQFL